MSKRYSGDLLRKKLRILLLFILLLALGCSRKPDSGMALVSIMAPTNLNPTKAALNQKDKLIKAKKNQKQNQKQNQLTSLAALPTDRKLCYGVSISGPGIDKTAASQCSPELSATAGFVEAGELMEVLIPKGEGRRIELFLFAQKVGENNPCPQMGSVLPPTRLKQVYLLGKVEGLRLLKDTEEVEIPVAFSGIEQNIAQSLALPPSCLTIQEPIGNENHKRFGIYTSSQKSSGAGYKLYGVVGKPTDSNVLSGGGFKLIVK